MGTLPAAGAEDATRWVEGKTVFEMARNLTLEQAAAKSLREAGLKQLARGEDLCYAFPTRYHQGRELDDTSHWMQLAAELFPELERQGWRISWGGELDFTPLRADDWRRKSKRAAVRTGSVSASVSRWGTSAWTCVPCCRR